MFQLVYEGGFKVYTLLWRFSYLLENYPECTADILLFPAFETLDARFSTIYSSQIKYK